MDIWVKLQAQRDPTLPLMPTKINTGSALPITVRGLPSSYAGGTVTGVAVTVTNADGAAITGTAAQNSVTGSWEILFAGSNFARYGFVQYGIKITVTVTSGSSTYDVDFVGDFEVAQATANATPGDPTSTFITKGSDQYWKSEVVDGVQHYKRVMIVNNPRIGWGFDFEGDYILVNGEFVAAE